MTQQDEILERVDKVGSKASEVIEALCEKLGVAAEHVYPILVRQQVIEGVTRVVLFFASLALAVWLGLLAKKYQAKSDYDDGKVALSAAATGIGVVAIILAIVGGGSTIGMIFNPEYAAMQNIVGMFK